MRFSPNNIEVNNTYFYDLQSNENGAAIYVNYSNTNCLLSYNSFSYCSSPVSLQKQGGCIYFSSYTGKFQCDKLCAYHCSANTSSVLYSSLEIDTTRNTNVISLFSYFQCPSKSSLTDMGSCRIYYGTSNAKDINSSQNYIRVHTDFGLHTAYDSYTKFSNFRNISANAIHNFWFSKTPPTLEYSSFISCSRPYILYGLIHYNTYNDDIPMYVKNCTFAYNEIVLFEVIHDSTMYVYDCFIDNYTYRSDKTSPSTSNIQTIPNNYLSSFKIIKTECKIYPTHPILIDNKFIRTFLTKYDYF